MRYIRQETPQDIAAIYDLNVAAFDQTEEADLVNALRGAGALRYSLVAIEAGEIIGHVAFSPVTITGDEKVLGGLGLAPMAVTPSRQREGIGTQLLNYWLENLAEQQDNFVIVVGHPDYYPRFGFQAGKPLGIRWEHDVPDDVFMVLELRPGALDEMGGVARFHSAFEAG